MSSDNKTKLDERLADRLALKKKQLDNFRPLPTSVVKQLYEELRVELTYHSNAIEGNTLSLHETRLVVKYGLTIGGHNLREHLEATNHAEAFDYLTKLAHDENAPLTLDNIFSLHRLVMDKLDPQAGQFRQAYVHIAGALIEPPPARNLPKLMQEWLSWVNGQERKQYHPIVQATIAHHGFETLHPFNGGNGRTGRLLLNLLLMRSGYVPALLVKNWRGGYISALRNADSGNYSPLANLIGLAVEGGLDLYLKACADAPNDLLKPLAELAKESGYDVNYLGLLIRQGRIEATKREGRWYSTQAAIAKYREETTKGLTKRGRPPKKE